MWNHMETYEYLFPEKDPAYSYAYIMCIKFS